MDIEDVKTSVRENRHFTDTLFGEDKGGSVLYSVVHFPTPSKSNRYEVQDRHDEEDARDILSEWQGKKTRGEILLLKFELVETNELSDLPLAPRNIEVIEEHTLSEPRV